MKKYNKKFVVICLSLLFVLIVLSSCVTTIRSGEVGVKTRFGKVLNQSTNECINFKLPFIFYN